MDYTDDELIARYQSVKEQLHDPKNLGHNRAFAAELGELGYELHTRNIHLDDE